MAEQVQKEKLCELEKVILRHVEVLELDIIVTTQDQRPKHVTGLVGSGR